MGQPTPNPEPARSAASTASAAAAPAGAASYRAGLERAMTLVWAEKTRHSVVTPAYFALKTVWEQLYHEANASDTHDKH